MTANKLKAMRARLGLTQEELAKQLGVTPNTVARWEQGIHAISPVVDRLLKVLACQIPAK
jgi:putative transcriptional regulator